MDATPQKRQGSRVGLELTSGIPDKKRALMTRTEAIKDIVLIIPKSHGRGKNGVER